MAALTPVASVEALVSVIEKSGLLAADALEKVREAAAKASDPKAMARDLVKSGTLTRWQAEQLINGYHRLLVGNYKLLDQIGTSPTGRLYLAEHAQMGRRHRLKVLARRLASNADAVKHFLDSARNACSLDHRNISHVYDVNQDRIGHYVVMEHVEGQDLEQLVERTGRVDPAQALEFMRQAAEGLAHAHASGVVHGDLKPANLLRDHSGTIKILEIGQAGLGAKPETEDADESVETASLAAVIFQAPELRGDGEAADVACDVYSIGSVLSFLLTAKAAKDGTAAVKLLEVMPEIPADASALCRRLMAEAPAERPGSMKEVLEAIGALTKQMAATAKMKSGEKRPADSPPPSPAGSKEKKGKAGGDKAAKEIKEPAAKVADGAVAVPPVLEVGQVVATATLKPPQPFTIKTRGRIGKKIRQAEGDAAAEATPAAERKLPWNPMYTPLVLAGAIGGGGVFVLLLLTVLVCVLAVRSGNKPVAEVTPTAAAMAQKVEAAAPAEPPETNPEAPVAETNPEVASATPAAADAAAVATTTPANPIGETKAVEAAVPVATENAANKVTKGEAAAATPAAVPMPESKPETIPEKKTEVAATTPEPKPAPAKAAAKSPPAADPFAGFAKAVPLPQLPDSADAPATTALSPIALGPCKADDKATLTIGLVGGETAIRNSKQKFELQPSPENKREWSFVLSGGATPVTMAGLTVQDGQLMFQWTEEAVKQAAVAKQLGNCALTLGAKRQVAALRTVERGAPLAVDIEKPGGSAKWNIGELPVAKQLFIEVNGADGFKVLRQDPKGPVNAGESVVVSTGPSEKSTPLQFKLSTSSTANAIDVRLQTTLKLEGGETRPYRRKDLVNLQQQTAQELTRLQNELRKSKDSRPRTEPEQKAKEATITRLSNDLASVNTMLDQLRYVLDFTGTTEGQGKLHFRVYYLAGDTKIDLLRTRDEPPPEKGK